MVETKKQTVRGCIKEYLKEHYGEWLFGGTLERNLWERASAKPSNISRTLRQMCGDGEIEKQYVPNPSGQGNVVVQYRVKILPRIEQKIVEHKDDTSQTTLF